MPSYFRVMPRELCPLKLSGIGSVVRQSNEVSSAAGGMSGCRSHQLHRHLVNSSAITVNKSCLLLTFLWRPSSGDTGLCTEALWGLWGCVCEDFGAETDFARDPNNNLVSEALTEHSLPDPAPLQGQPVPLGCTWTICWRLGWKCASGKHPTSITTFPMGSGLRKTPGL